MLLDDAHDVLWLEPDRSKLDGWDIGVDEDPGVTALLTILGTRRPRCARLDSSTEDPVTGSLNADLGQWLAGTVLPEQYVAAQGTAIGRRGRVHVRRDGAAVWVGGDTRTTLLGSADLGA